MTQVLILQHTKSSGMGILDAEIRGLDVKVDHRHLYMDDSVPDPSKANDYDALFLLGGSMSATETKKYPFLAQEVELLKETLKRKKPILGICLGAQLLAIAAGTNVLPLKNKEMGWYPVELDDTFSKRNPIFQNLPRRFFAFHWHQDTFNIPSTGYRLASSEICPNQAFCVNGNAYGIQFHMETTEDMVRLWLDQQRKELRRIEKDLIQTVLTDTAKHLPEFNDIGIKIFEGFTSFIKIQHAKPKQALSTGETHPLEPSLPPS